MARERNKPSTNDSTTDAATVAATGEQPTQEVMAVRDMFSEEALRDIVSFEDAARLLYANDVAIDDAATVIGDGFALIRKERKGILVGVPLLILEWNFYPGDYGDTFVAMRVVARNPDGSAGKYIVSDGSTGIAESLRKYTARTGKATGLMVRNGFRASDYTYCNTCDRPLRNGEADDEHRDAGEHVKATTYYLDTSA